MVGRRIEADRIISFGFGFYFSACNRVSVASKGVHGMEGSGCYTFSSCEVNHEEGLDMEISLHQPKNRVIDSTR